MIERSRTAHMEGARGEEEPRLRAIIDHVADGIVIVGGDGTVRFVNPSAERLFGRGAEELLGQPFGFQVANGTTEIDVVRRGREPTVAELRVAEMEWEGEPALLVSVRDITDRKEAEQRRQELIREQAARGRAEAEERRFRFLAAAGSVLDSSLDFPTVLSRLAGLLVSPLEEIENHDRPDLSPPRLADWCVIDVVGSDRAIQRIATVHHDAAKEPMLACLVDEFPADWTHPFPAMLALRTGEPVLYRTVDAEVLAGFTRSRRHATMLSELGVASLMALPLVARGETLGAVTLARAQGSYTDADLALARDLAQRSALSIASARLYREAQEANRAKSDFLAVMSHELRTPLNAIMGYTDLLEAEIAGPVNTRQKEHLEHIASSSRHLLQIVEEILTYARLEAGREELHPVRVELRELVEEVASMIRPLATRKGLDFRVLQPESPIEIETDADKTRQILLNLLSNAVKFTDRGSVQVEVRQDGSEPVIRVADTGVGIRPEHLERIFEPFWQVEQSISRTEGGTGLGLSVVQRLTELLGGSLSADSVLGQGTTFTLWLPSRVSRRTAE